jgi:putative addiction module component (TIGR02574 family)
MRKWSVPLRHPIFRNGIACQMVLSGQGVPMSPVTDVLDVALRLSESERAKIAEALIDSLEVGGDRSNADDALESEIDRRLELFREGKTTSEDWQVVIQRLKADLASRHP